MRQRTTIRVLSLADLALPYCQRHLEYRR